MSNKPRYGSRPIVEMIHRDSDGRCRIRALLNTGCSLPCLDHSRPGSTFATSSRVSLSKEPGKNTLYLSSSTPKHYSQEVFEVAPLEPEVDVFM